MTVQKSNVIKKEFKKTLALSIGTKSVILALILWFILGAFGVHRMYLGSILSGVAMALLSIFSAVAITYEFMIGEIAMTIVLIWWVVDFFLLMAAEIKHNKSTS